jgi:hypothetical protein
MKIFAVVLVAACFTVSIAGAYIGVVYLPQFLTDNPVVPEAVPTVGAEVQMPENQPSQQRNPPTQTTPQPTPTEKTATIHVYEFCIYNGDIYSSLVSELKQLGNYYAASTSTMYHFAVGGGPHTILKIAFYKPITNGQSALVDKNCCKLYGDYYTVEVPQSTVDAYEQAKYNIEWDLDNWLPQSGI